MCTLLPLYDDENYDEYIFLGTRTVEDEDKDKDKDKDEDEEEKEKKENHYYKFKTFASGFRVCIFDQFGITFKDGRLLYFDFEVFRKNSNHDDIWISRLWFIILAMTQHPKVNINEIWNLLKEHEATNYFMNDKTIHQTITTTTTSCSDPNLLKFPLIDLNTNLLVCSSCSAPVDIEWTPHFTKYEYEKINLIWFGLWDRNDNWIYWIPEEVLYEIILLTFSHSK
jgi:hypothetical protein